MPIVSSCVLNLPSHRFSKILCFIFLTTISLTMALNSPAAPEMLGNPLEFLQSHPSELLNIRSKEEALQIFLQSNPALISQIGPRQTRKGRPVKIQIPSDVQEAITQIMAGLVALQTVKDPLPTNEPSQSGLQSESLTPIQLAQFQWMADTSIYKKLMTLKNLEDALASLQSTQAPPVEGSDQHYLQFEQFFDLHFPLSTENTNSWYSLLKEQGLQGLQSRLEEFRNPLQSSPHGKPLSDADISRIRQQYIRSRLVPHFQAYVHHESIELQKQAYTILLTQGPFITKWQKQERERTTSARLCGSWLWTLHNHQNHQDHKMTVHFPAPGEPIPPNEPTPNTVSLHGDTVYVEWIFPQGKQEDSLLLSNRDSIMEGTFKNTLGPYGSITGKRLSHCKP